MNRIESHVHFISFIRLYTGLVVSVHATTTMTTFSFPCVYCNLLLLHQNPNQTVTKETATTLTTPVPAVHTGRCMHTVENETEKKKRVVLYQPKRNKKN